MMNKPKILMFDIETTPNLATIWSTGKQFVNYESIWKEKKISCICWKWLGESKIYSLSMNLKKHNLMEYDDDADKEMLVKFSEIYNKADVAVGHNAIKFDKGTITARLSKHGLPPISPTIIDDTWRISCPINFNSHKLDYLARYFKVGTKAAHSYSLWLKVMRSDSKALNDTVKYCKKDVILLEKVYKKLLPYVKTKFNHAIYQQDTRVCPSCSGKLKISSKRMSVGLGMRVQFSCNSCGKHVTIGENLIKKGSTYPRQV